MTEVSRLASCIDDSYCLHWCEVMSWGGVNRPVNEWYFQSTTMAQ